MLALIAMPGAGGAAAGAEPIRAMPAAGVAPVDTHGDRLTDGEEIAIRTGTGTDPLTADTDGDGFGDGTEVEAGTDPLAASDVPADDQSPAASASARPTARPSTGGAVSGLPSTGTGTDVTSSDSGLFALLASGVLGTVAAAFGLRRHQA